MPIRAAAVATLTRVRFKGLRFIELTITAISSQLWTFRGERYLVRRVTRGEVCP
jgi:hypothetical protein